MLIHVNCAKCVGIEAVGVTVEVDVVRGVGIHLVGLADAAVKESLLRTITALQSLGYHIPGKKIVINLAPADIHKSGSGYDLPIAVGILAASLQEELPGVENCLVMGELSLDAAVREVPGALPIAEYAAERGFSACILPRNSALEVRGYARIPVYGIDSLADAVRILSFKEDCSALLIENLEPRTAWSPDGLFSSDYMDFSEIIGQNEAKRGLEVAASGAHNVIMIGSPGSGKSSLAKALTGILPPMEPEEALVTSKIYSVAGNPRGLCPAERLRRPFRAPHCSASMASIFGGGSGENICPGEVSLSHNGVLFLDEFLLMPRSVTEALRAPLEDRKICISRLKSKVEFPSSFMLVAASNPCPCGYYGEGDRCSCSPGKREGYLMRLSGPIMDRIDIQLTVRSIPASELVSRRGAGTSESSAVIARRVAAARQVQKERFKDEGIFTNAEMSSRQIERFCQLSDDCKDLLTRLIGSLGLSARAYTRILKVARTIADLAGEEDIRPEHLMEASAYRFLDRSKF